MFCTNCGNQFEQEAKFCSQCGSQGQHLTENVSDIKITRTEFNSLPVASLPTVGHPSMVPPQQTVNQVYRTYPDYQYPQGNFIGYRPIPTTSGTAVAAIIIVFFFSLLGLILGYVARNEINKSNGMKTGAGMATTSIVLGWIFTILGFFWFIGATSG
jgi:hypothetical protein